MRKCLSCLEFIRKDNQKPTKYYVAAAVLSSLPKKIALEIWTKEGRIAVPGLYFTDFESFSVTCPCLSKYKPDLNKHFLSQMSGQEHPVEPKEERNSLHFFIIVIPV